MFGMLHSSVVLYAGLITRLTFFSRMSELTQLLCWCLPTPPIWQMKKTKRASGMEIY